MNDYVHILHQRRSAGLSLYDCFSGYASVDYDEPLIDFPEKFLQELDPTSRIVCDRTIEEYQTACRICENPQKHPLKGIGLTTYSPSVKTKVRDITEAIDGR